MSQGHFELFRNPSQSSRRGPKQKPTGSSIRAVVSQVKVRSMGAMGNDVVAA